MSVVTVERLVYELADLHGDDYEQALVRVVWLAHEEGFGWLAAGDTMDEVQVRVVRDRY